MLTILARTGLMLAGLAIGQSAPAEGSRTVNPQRAAMEAERLYKAKAAKASMTQDSLRMSVTKGALEDSLMVYPLLPEAGEPDSVAQFYRLEAVRSYYQGIAFGNRHRADVFRWQHFSTQAIFVMVHVLVIAGLFFSWLQFRDDLQRRRRADVPSKKLQVTPEPLEGKTTLRADLQGIEVSSSVLGVIILVISLLFFYLYLVHVYPITIVR